ncbi:MAG: CHAT domain-containing protein [Chitinophagales bacterium]|nr:CHAT domain-containing protein [Chitinophagales bacterium]
MKYFYFVLIPFIFLMPGQAQIHSFFVQRIEIKQALNDGKIEAAVHLMDIYITFYLKEKNIDSLISVIPLKAEITLKKTNQREAVRQMDEFTNRLSELKPTTLQMIEMYRSVSSFLESIYELKKAYLLSDKALQLCPKLDKQKEFYTAKLEYDLGVIAYKMADIHLAEKHYLKALEIKLHNPSTTHEDLYLTYNSVGMVYWHKLMYKESKLYFQHALAELKYLPQNNVNAHYRPALIKSNLIGIYREEENIPLALRTSYEVIKSLQLFIKSKGGDTKKTNAKEDLYAAIDNLACIYGDIGNYHKKESLLLYSYRQKKKEWNTKNPGVFISEILLGQHYNDIKEYGTAQKYLDVGLRHLDESGDNYTFWKADAMYELALVYQNTHQIAQAEKAYLQAEELYEESYEGAYDNTYLDFLRNKALFLASNRHLEEAISTVDKIKKYLLSINEENKIQKIQYYINLAQVYELAGQYRDAVKNSRLALNLTEIDKSDFNLIDSIISERFTPIATLMYIQSSYVLQKNKSIDFLTKIFQTLTDVVNILDKKKTMLNTSSNSRFLVSEYHSLINFYAQIAFELYRKTGQKNYLETFINVCESSLYNKIRNRLNTENANAFSKIPKEIIEKENRLKNNLQNAVEAILTKDEDLNEYLKADKKWQDYLLYIQNLYPTYYKMRYSTLYYTLPAIQKLIPENTSIIRYYQLDTAWIAVLMNKKEIKAFSLSTENLNTKINSIVGNTLGEQEQLDTLYQLYRQLWQPFENEISTKKVMVIPDGILYHLSMDMLPFAPIKRWKELVQKSLLSRYTFSTHYSVFMLNDKTKSQTFKENYIVYAPGFSDKMKKKYLRDYKDTFDIDEKYLKLLPQPFSQELAKKVQKKFHGEAYTADASTLNNFIKYAGNHKVIHLATHAEFDNIHPEQSGLYFAKDSTNENFLSLNAIYNADLQSNLMILTACESGRPGNFDGEGLISLAHAFNYAGSKNILTALWKIDEKSSAEITEKFLEFLQKGLPDDEALRMAKLEYLRKNDGRLLAPSYWAGLVLMGQTETIDIHNPLLPCLCIVLIIGTLSLSAFVYKRLNC